MTATTEKLPLRERAAQAAKAAQEKAEREEREGREQSRGYAISQLCDALKRAGLADPVADGIGWDEGVEGVIEGIAFEVDGLAFGMGRPYWESPPQLCVRVECKRGCGKPFWAPLSDWGTLASLDRALTEEHDHRTCLIQYDDEGELTTDEWGKPLAPFAERKPVQTPTEPPAIAGIEAAGAKLAQATEREQELQALRGIRKDEAVRRVMAARGIAATPAEKIVEEDEEYFAFLKDCRSAVAERIKAEARYEAEKLRAYLAVRTEVALS